MNRYLAKSNPEETIQEHTDNLLTNYKILQEIYPEIPVNWYFLKLACLTHDLGKMNVYFQEKVSGGRRNKKEIPHNYLSVAFVPYKKLKEEGYSKEEIQLLFQAVARHHERDIHFTLEEWSSEMRNLEQEWNGFTYEALGENRAYRNRIPSKYYQVSVRIFEGDNAQSFELFIQYVLLKGLLNRIDFAASAYIDVEKPNDFLESALNNQLETFRKSNPDADWKPLQKYMYDHQQDNIIVVAETGMGKTEAGLLWLGNNKGFFTLPLRTAINAIYDRLAGSEAGIIRENVTDRVGLLHSETYGQYLQREKDIQDIEEYFTKTRQMSLPITVCTLDQLFDFVFRYAGFEPKLATLSYSKVIIDEVQMYSPDLLAYLIVGLSYIQKVGGQFAILTATLPGIIPDLLAKNGVSFTRAEKDFISDRIRHSLEVVHEQINSDFISDFYDGNRILVICNTVRVAKEMYEELEKTYGDEVKLIHSQFIKRDRNAKSDAILADGHKTSEGPCIWVATQVVEASLDIDFDLLFTELSDLNGLFQRMGRCYRNRELDVATNVYVFDEKCSGIGKNSVIDPLIHQNSRKALQEVGGSISEAEKLALIDRVYSTEALEGSDYYTAVIDNIDYVQSFHTYELDKKTVREKFRNINSVTVIPEPVFDENRAEIEGYMAEMAMKGKKNRRRRMVARTRLSEFMMDAPGYIVKKGDEKKIKITKYENISVFECEYSSNLGITPKDKSQEELFF
ncbi:CRISPR-associated helicase Cas3' [Listeria booriae]|uniref:CRISPR-associated helicase Cas3 n=1 Tax=Listeria booriae TaxID=1552123 RepID=A0A7X0XAD7_9LIST|nr:CRISPR-associated helicase Cas3' [Listeria booriae]MBC1490523.1 CRISPR-associated helicase Cas3' [Listeria booriae]MBC1503675.1 CRISPR-associated helicase Cas3' [Listeria booriae]MBC1525626.1 CRISPR-associated helicase Cas3' [Listeria booriae]